MNRLDRLTAILIQLQSKRVVKAQDIAERFEISLRTVYRDIRTLEEAGVPIVGEAGVGYSIMEGYRLPPVMFTEDEATAFLTAEKLVEKLTDSNTGNAYKSALYKIRSVLRSSEKDHLESIEDRVEVLKNKYLPENKQEFSPLPVILNGIAQKCVLQMNYFAGYKGEASSRKVEPVGVFLQGNYWYLIAYCRLRNDYRTFRTDRISGLHLCDERFVQEHPTLKKYLFQVTKEKELINIVIEVDNDVLNYLGEQKYYNGYVSERNLGTKTEMTFLSTSLEGFARWFLLLGDHADIVKPVALKKRVNEIVSSVQKRLKK